MPTEPVSRRCLLKRCAGTTSALFSTALLPNLALAAKDDRPNIVLFVSDDHGLDALGCYGNPVIKTPNLDALAAEGSRFTNAFCTSASCSASRSVILTGLYNHANGQYGHQHDYHHFITFHNIKSLPVLLTEAGYRTARVGKYHVAPEEVYRFETVLKANSRNPVEMAEKSRPFLNADDDRPFFLYFCTSDPHRGGGTADELPHKPDRFGNKPQGRPGVETVRYDPKDVIVPPFLPDIPTCRAELAQYYQSCSRIDQGVGRLITALKDTRQYDNTVFIYISDNGVAFPGAKTTLYEPGMNLPCIVRVPGQKKKNITCDALVNFADLTPTILDIAGAMPNETKFHGRSFKSVIQQQHPAGWDETYASHTFHEITMYYPMRVVRRRKYKLIWNIAYPLPYPFSTDTWAAPTWQATLNRGDKFYGKRTVDAYLHRPKFELYDLENDPDEVNNLANNPQHSNVLEQLKKKLMAFQKRTKDPWILKWQYD